MSKQDKNSKEANQNGSFEKFKNKKRNKVKNKKHKNKKSYVEDLDNHKWN